MIATLRRRHRRMIAMLVIIAPAVLVAALVAKVDDAPGTLPAGLVAEPNGPPIATLALEPRRPTDPGGTVVVYGAHLVVELDGPLRAPAVLAYWLPEPAATPGDGSHALGPVSHGRRNVFDLPAAARSDGDLLLWSLGHARPVATARLPPTDAGRSAESAP